MVLTRLLPVVGGCSVRNRNWSGSRIRSWKASHRNRIERKGKTAGTTQATSIASKPAGIRNRYRHRKKKANNRNRHKKRIASNRHRNRHNRNRNGFQRSWKTSRSCRAFSC